MNCDNRYLKAIRELNVCTHKGQRRPHQPLLLLVAISNLFQGKPEISFSDAVELLGPLLDSYAPPVEARHQPELPYWHLRSSGLWEVEGASELPLQRGGFPRMAGLKQTSGRLEPGFAEALGSDQGLVRTSIVEILNTYFPESLHSDILAMVGLEIPNSDDTAGTESVQQANRRRDPHFRKNVLRVYEHRCAVSGFRAALGGQFFGCEAAHVQWHAYKGPDSIENGFAVEPTLHKLFDAGAWTLSDDRRILVSAEFTGTDATIDRIRSLHGRRIRKPQIGSPEIAVEYIRWHREADLGGVFRLPALPI